MGDDTDLETRQLRLEAQFEETFLDLRDIEKVITNLQYEVAALKLAIIATNGAGDRGPKAIRAFLDHYIATADRIGHDEIVTILSDIMNDLPP